MKTTRTPRRRDLCACCGHPGLIEAYSYRVSCYERWLAAGRPTSGPPAPQPSEQRTRNRERGERDRIISSYRRLRRVRSFTTSEAAAAIGVSLRTARRYNAEIRAGAR